MINEINSREKTIDTINRRILMWAHIGLVANFFTFNLFIYAAMWKGVIFLPFVLAGIAFMALAFCIDVKINKLEYLCGKLCTCTDDLQSTYLEPYTTLSATLDALFSLKSVLFVVALFFMIMAAK